MARVQSLEPCIVLQCNLYCEEEKGNSLSVLCLHVFGQICCRAVFCRFFLFAFIFVRTCLAVTFPVSFRSNKRWIQTVLGESQRWNVCRWTRWATYERRIEQAKELFAAHAGRESNEEPRQRVKNEKSCHRFGVVGIALVSSIHFQCPQWEFNGKLIVASLSDRTRFIRGTTRRSQFGWQRSTSECNKFAWRCAVSV